MLKSAMGMRHFSDIYGPWFAGWSYGIGGVVLKPSPQPASPMSRELWDFFTWTVYRLVQQLVLCRQCHGYSISPIEPGYDRSANHSLGFHCSGATSTKTGPVSPSLKCCGPTAGRQDCRSPMSKAIQATLSQQDLQEQEISIDIHST